LGVPFAAELTDQKILGGRLTAFVLYARRIARRGCVHDAGRYDERENDTPNHSQSMLCRRVVDDEIDVAMLRALLPPAWW
jgi:hypothetical protein